MWAPNWGRLFAEWRCKAIWVPFSDKEWEAIKSWVNAKSIQSWEIKIDEEVIKVIKDKKIWNLQRFFHLHIFKNYLALSRQINLC